MSLPFDVFEWRGCPQLKGLVVLDERFGPRILPLKIVISMIIARWNSNLSRDCINSCRSRGRFLRKALPSMVTNDPGATAAYEM